MLILRFQVGLVYSGEEGREGLAQIDMYTFPISLWEETSTV